MKRVAITGPTGFIGTHLLDRLRKEGVELKLFDRKKHSLGDVDSLINLMKGCDTIFHLAAINDPNNPEIFKVNVLGTGNLVDAIKKVGNEPRIVFASTIGVCKPTQKGNVINEECEISPRNRYTLSKLLGEELVRYFSEMGNMEAVILRLSNVYGIGDRVGRSVTANFLDAAKSREPLVLYGDGNQTRDFVYIDDVVEALARVGSAKIDRKVLLLNICSGEETSLKSLVSLVKQLTDGKVDVIHKTPNISGGGFWKGDNSLARKLLGWQPKVSLKEGLKLTYQNI